MGGGRDISIIRKRLILAIDEEDIFRLEIGVNEVEIVEDWEICKRFTMKPRGSILTSYARKELSGKALNLRAGEGHKSISLEEVEDALS
jgi:hypothetical protein